MRVRIAALASQCRFAFGVTRFHNFVVGRVRGYRPFLATDLRILVLPRIHRSSTICPLASHQSMLHKFLSRVPPTAVTAHDDRDRHV